MLTRISVALMALALVLPPAVAPAIAADIDSSTWSETASSNNAASPDGWTSGTMLPSQVEPTAREMMAALKRFYDHVNATATSGGTANVQTLTYTVAPAAYVTGQCFTFKVGGGLTNTGSMTLNVNTLGAKTVQYAGAALNGGELVAGTINNVCYDGTNFQLIGTSGASTLGASMVLISTQTASGSASIAFTGINGFFRDYFLQCRDIIPATNASNLFLQVGEGGSPTWETGASYSYALYGEGAGNAAINAGATGQTGILLTGHTIPNASFGFSMELWLHNPSGTSLNKNIEFKSSYENTVAGSIDVLSGGGWYTADTIALTAIRVLAGSGNLISGSCSLYGLRN